MIGSKTIISILDNFLKKPFSFVLLVLSLLILRPLNYLLNIRFILIVMITAECVTYSTWCERLPRHGKAHTGFYLPCSPYSWPEHCEPDEPPRYI